MAGQRRYPTDPNHPDFPHGKLHAYNNLGCKCDRCKRAGSRAKKAWEHRKITGRKIDTDLLDEETTAKAVGRLRELAAEHSLKQITRATGIRHGYLCQIVNNTYVPKRMTVKVVRRIMQADLGEGSDVQVPSARYIQRAYSLAALGYPLVWIAHQVGADGGRLAVYATGRRWERTAEHVHVSTFRKLDELYRKIGDTPAEKYPGNAFTSRQITVAKTTARKWGYHPPIHYGDDGELIPGSVRDEGLEKRKETRDKLARERLDVLRLTLIQQMSAGEITNLTGLHYKKIERIRREAGLRFRAITVGRDLGESEQRMVLQPGYEVRAAKVRAAVEEHDIDLESDAFETVRRLGMMQDSRYDFDSPPAEIPDKPPSDTTETATAA